MWPRRTPEESQHEVQPLRRDGPLRRPRCQLLASDAAKPVAKNSGLGATGRSQTGKSAQRGRSGCLSLTLLGMGRLGHLSGGRWLLGAA